MPTSRPNRSQSRPSSHRVDPLHRTRSGSRSGSRPTFSLASASASASQNRRSRSSATVADSGVIASRRLRTRRSWVHPDRGSMQERLAAWVAGVQEGDEAPVGQGSDGDSDEDVRDEGLSEDGDADVLHEEEEDVNGVEVEAGADDEADADANADANADAVAGAGADADADADAEDNSVVRAAREAEAAWMNLVYQMVIPRYDDHTLYEVEPDRSATSRPRRGELDDRYEPYHENLEGEQEEQDAEVDSRSRPSDMVIGSDTGPEALARSDADNQSDSLDPVQACLLRIEHHISTRLRCETCSSNLQWTTVPLSASQSLLGTVDRYGVEGIIGFCEKDVCLTSWLGALRSQEVEDARMLVPLTGEADELQPEGRDTQTGTDWHECAGVQVEMRDGDTTDYESGEDQEGFGHDGAQGHHDSRCPSVAVGHIEDILDSVIFACGQCGDMSSLDDGMRESVISMLGRTHGTAAEDDLDVENQAPRGIQDPKPWESLCRSCTPVV